MSLRNKNQRENSKNSLIENLIEKYGISNESLTGIELESKLNFKDAKSLINAFESTSIDPPYIQNTNAQNSFSEHSFYGSLNRNFQLDYAFAKMKFSDSNTIKIKGKSKIIQNKGIYLIKRNENHIKNIYDIDVEKFIENLISKFKKESKFLVYLGKFEKENSEKLICNINTGRIFCIGANICTAFNKKQLFQLEFEYKCKLNRFSSNKKIEDELYEITNLFLSENKNAESTILTKFQWLENLYNEK